MSVYVNITYRRGEVSNKGVQGRWLASQSYILYDLVRKPSTLDALIRYFSPSHVIHQRLLLQFLSAPEDGSKKRPKHVEYYCSY